MKRWFSHNEWMISMISLSFVGMLLCAYGAYLAFSENWIIFSLYTFGGLICLVVIALVIGVKKGKARN